MTPERWQRIKDVFTLAAEHEPGQRSGFLDEACANDCEMRLYIESLLAHDDSRPGLLEPEFAGKCLADERDRVVQDAFRDDEQLGQGLGHLLERSGQGSAGIPAAGLSLGSEGGRLTHGELVGPGNGEPQGRASAPTSSAQIGPYRILSRLGAGGMGEVYLAEDNRLGRKVALKVLAPPFINNAVCHARFLREAQLASALDHPNICTIYEVGAADGVSFISMQYVEGDTLQHVVSRHALSLETLLSIALQVAEGLGAAHARGIVHRDIKSSNIMLTPRGQIKVLDFGIAKLLERFADVPPASNLTRSGMIFGTPSYLSPEQARGERADHRSDIFSFGTVLYEMATGQVPFNRRSAAETMNAVINQPHDPVSEINDQIPSALVNIIDRALAKDPSKRYQSIDDMRVELRQIAQRIGLVGTNVAEAGLDSPILHGAALHGGRVRRFFRLKRMRRSWGAVGLAAALALVGASATAWLSNTGKSINSIAVLPFGYEGTATDLDYLADGIGEGVTGRLSQLSQLRVIARSTMFTYGGRKVDPRVVGRELGVQAVLTGQVLRRDDTVIVRLELVDVKDGSRLWGEEYSRPRSELFAVPGDLARAVSRELGVRLRGEDERRLTRDYTRSADAYHLYLKGRFFWNRRTSDAYAKAIEYFTSAIDHDRTFALAYSGLADTYLMQRGYGMRSPEQTVPQAAAAAEQALRIDDTITEAHTSLAQVRAVRQDWVGAEAEFKRAIELNGNYATAHHWYAIYLAQVGRLDEALAAIRRAQGLDPLSLVINTEVGRVYYFARRYDDAIAQYSRTLEMDQNFALAHLHLGMALVQKGLNTEAIAEFRKAAPLGGPMPAVGVIRAHALAGRRREANDLFQQLLGRMEHGFAPPYAMALAYTSLGDHERAISWLEKGTGDAGGGWFLKVNPPWDVLRSNPRFQAVVRRAGLTP
jgi:eukaryotic-like serine/threonine-protein kinase